MQHGQTVAGDGPFGDGGFSVLDHRLRLACQQGFIGQQGVGLDQAQVGRHMAAGFQTHHEDLQPTGAPSIGVHAEIR